MNLQRIDKKLSIKFLFDSNFKYKLAVSFIICFVLIASYNLWFIYINHPVLFHANMIPLAWGETFQFNHGDDDWYWVVAKSFQGIFDDNIAIHKIAHRGYFFTFAIYLVQQLADILHIDKMLFFQIVWAGMFSFSIAILIPKFSELLTQRKTNVLQSLLLLALISFFWRGFFYVPLADFPGLFSFIAGLYALVKYHRSNKLTYLFMAGLFITMAALCRGSYKYSFYLVVAYLIYMHFPIVKGAYKNISIKFSKELLAFFLGMLFISWPEAYLNKTKLGVISFFPYAQINWVKEDGTANESNVTSMQLQHGIGIQKFGNFHDRHGASIRIKDINKKHDLALSVPNTSPEYWKIWMQYPLKSMKEYTLLLLSHPIDFTVIYFRHLFNGLNLQYPQGYYLFLHKKYHAYTNGAWFLIINYIILYIGLWCVIKNFKFVLRNKEYLGIYSLLLVPSVFAIPAMIETRFILSMHVLFYGILCFYVCRSRKNMINISTIVKENYLGCCLFVLFSLCLSSAIFGYL